MPADISDTPPENGNDSETTSETLPLMVTHQYVKDLSFENPTAPDIFISAAVAPEVELEVNVQAQRIGDQNFEVILRIEATARAEDVTVFIVELDYAGIAEISEIPQEHLQSLILIEVPRLLFPYARAIVSEVTRDGGFPPLLIGPVDFVDMFRRTIESENQVSSEPSTEGSGAIA